mmetsp:Transcript_4940/g.14552  ORF Transcript_4940/g.14552 Transcript_4940/m.14552 type:complete len:322 (+) Transcript_4940:321-1286(+)
MIVPSVSTVAALPGSPFIPPRRPPRRARSTASRSSPGGGDLLGNHGRVHLGPEGAQRRAHVLLVERSGAELGEDVHLHDGVARVRDGLEERGLLGGGLALVSLERAREHVRLHGARHPVPKHGDARARVRREVDVLLEGAPHARVVRDEGRRRLDELVVRRVVGGAQGPRGDESHRRAHRGDGEVVAHAVERPLGVREEALHRVVHQRPQAARVLVARAPPERGVAEEEGGERVGEAARHHLLPLERAAEEQGHVGGRGEGGGEARELRLVVRECRRVHRRLVAALAAAHLGRRGGEARHGRGEGAGDARDGCGHAVADHV